MSLTIFLGSNSDHPRTSSDLLRSSRAKVSPLQAAGLDSLADSQDESPHTPLYSRGEANASETPTKETKTAAKTQAQVRLNNARTFSTSTNEMNARYRTQ